jgi:gas vesicle protein
MNLAKFLEGLLLGTITGAALGLLMAPQKGQELQNDVRERINLVMEEGRRASAERRAELEAQFAQARQVKPAGSAK